MQINFESESPKNFICSIYLAEQNSLYRNNTLELAEQCKVDFHHDFILNFVIKVNRVRAWDYPKIAVCTDTSCACYSLKIPYVSEAALAFQSCLWYTVVSRMKT